RVGGADADEGDGWMYRVEEGAVLIGGAVVGDLEHVGVGYAGSEFGLFLGFGVAGEQDRGPVDHRAQDERVVVGVGAGAREGTVGAEQVDADPAEGGRPAGWWRGHGYAVRVRGLGHGVAAGGRFEMCRDQRGADAPVAEHAV